MSRTYKPIKQFTREVLRLKKEGITNKEIGEKLGLELSQVKGLIKRYNRSQRPKTEQEIKAEALTKQTTPKKEQTLEQENKRLRMENDLLRDFLRECGKR